MRFDKHTVNDIAGTAVEFVYSIPGRIRGDAILDTRGQSKRLTTTTEGKVYSERLNARGHIIGRTLINDPTFEHKRLKREEMNLVDGGMYDIAGYVAIGTGAFLLFAVGALVGAA